MIYRASAQWRNNLYDELVIDNFAGGGGAGLGIELALGPAAVEFRDRVRSDPDYFDPRFAGWWAWGMCCWIGGGWCSYAPEQNRTPGLSQDGWGLNATGDLHTKRPALGSGGNGGDGMKGVNARRPQLCNGNTKHGVGVHGEIKQSKQIPDLSGESGAVGRGVNRKLPQRMPAMEKSAGGGKGVQGRPAITDAFSRGRGVNANDRACTCEDRRAWLIDWFRRLRDRYRPVRVCCGDWQRVCDSDSTLTRIGGDFKDGKQSGTGVFLDPPYALKLDRLHAIIAELCGEQPKGGGLFGSSELVTASSDNRNAALYGTDTDDVDRLVARVHVWCRERGADPRIRIALCGYEGEHNALEDLGWIKWSWKTQGGYGNRKKAGGGENTNKHRERVWFSPACLNTEEA